MMEAKVWSTLTQQQSHHVNYDVLLNGVSNLTIRRTYLKTPKEYLPDKNDIREEKTIFQQIIAA